MTKHATSQSQRLDVPTVWNPIRHKLSCGANLGWIVPNRLRLRAARSDNSHYIIYIQGSSSQAESRWDIWDLDGCVWTWAWLENALGTWTPTGVALGIWDVAHGITGLGNKKVPHQTMPNYNVGPPFTLCLLVRKPHEDNNTIVVRYKYHKQ